MPNSAHEPPIIFQVAVALPFHSLFDYLPPNDPDNKLDYRQLPAGTRLRVPFGLSNSQIVGFLIAITNHSDWELHKIKAVERILDNEPLLSASDMKLLHWVSRYYHFPLGVVIGTAFPLALRQGKPAVISGKAEQYYQLTALGSATELAQLKQARKQQQLLEKFQQHSGGLSESQLNVWQLGWRTTAKQLVAKQLLEIIELPVVTQSEQRPYRAPLETALVCNPAQQAAIDAVCASLAKFSVFLLEGVTGSGKTEVYMQIIEQVLQRGQQVLVLVPEISLTPQLQARFQRRFAITIVISHSKLSDKQRQDAWLKMQQGTAAMLLGTRSALFTPLQNAGLIILDEEHDSSFKQQDGFRFSARDVAVMRGKLLGIPVLLGSATPSLESLHNASKQRYQLLHLPERAGSAVKPQLQLLDIRNKKMHEGVSEFLLQDIRRTLANGEQTLLFLNRRGFAPTLICHGCGWVARCSHCDANLVIHADDNRLRCHHCAKEYRLLNHCPDCQTGRLTPLGLGTERVEQLLNRLFPDKIILRLDHDSTQRKGSLENYLQQINDGEVDIILGTQMLAKGHHFPNVTLVAILDVDSGLFSLDFHAAEKLAQLIVQVSGRAGRAEKAGKVVMQTRQPEHPLLTTLIKHDYRRFAQNELAERAAALLPPFSYQALLRVQAANDVAPPLFMKAVIALATQHNTGSTLVLGPVSAPMAKRAGQHRYQLLFQDNHRHALHALLARLIPDMVGIKQAKNVRWSLDVDPVDLY